jgi:uncharacterized SAM-dependent methyltransferase
MPSAATVTIHHSQFPGAVRRDLLHSLRTRRVNHKFHYDSVKQTQKWLALHEAYSPSRNDTDCAAAYNRAFNEAVAGISARRVHLVGLGCGGGQKDTRLLRRLKSGGRTLFYTPSDVSVAMTLVARKAALSVVRPENCFPFVCDLATATDLGEELVNSRTRGAKRIITFFGMIPNFEPYDVLPRLAKLVRRGDILLFSANLAPGNDYAAGVKRILPQYNNPLTREWLITFLLDLGVERRDGKIEFRIEAGACDLKRIVAHFQFTHARSVEVESQRFSFRRGESIRLFFSYRYTPERVRTVLKQYGLETTREWIIPSGEEGVFLCQRQ